MLKANVPWSLKDVLLVHGMRLLVGYIVIRFIYPVFFVATSPVIEITDRVVVVTLVWFTVRRHGGTLAAAGLSARNGLKNVVVGIAAGFVLLGVSIFSERLYTTVLFLSPTQHPLVAQVERAVSWSDLFVPLLLAGLAAPVAEEMLYRLFTFGALKDRFGLWAGAIGSAAIFALFHFNAFWLAEMMVVGTGLALLYFWTGSLVSSITAHSVINTSKIVMIFLQVSYI